MIVDPLYLSAYPFGQLIEFQVEQNLKKNDFAPTVEKLYSQGRLTPQLWMEKGLGEQLSAEPLLNATSKAISQYHMQ
jgi:hypothetical protein